MGMNSKNRFVPDAAFRLRAADAAAITADLAIMAGELKTPRGAIWNAEVADGNVAIKIKASEMATGGGDETYAVSVITSASADMSSPTVHETKSLVAGWANELLVDQHNLAYRAPEHEYWGLSIDVGGVAPSIKAEIYVLPDSGKAV